MTMSEKSTDFLRVGDQPLIDAADGIKASRVAFVQILDLHKEHLPPETIAMILQLARDCQNTESAIRQATTKASMWRWMINRSRQGEADLSPEQEEADRSRYLSPMWQSLVRQAEAVLEMVRPRASGAANSSPKGTDLPIPPRGHGGEEPRDAVRRRDVPRSGKR
jgi:hypothetical protein